MIHGRFPPPQKLNSSRARAAPCTEFLRNLARTPAEPVRPTTCRHGARCPAPLAASAVSQHMSRQITRRESPTLQHVPADLPLFIPPSAHAMRRACLASSGHYFSGLHIPSRQPPTPPKQQPKAREPIPRSARVLFYRRLHPAHGRTTSNGIRNSKLLTAPIRSGRVALLEFGIPNSCMIEPPLPTGRRPTGWSGRRGGRKARAAGAAHGFRRTTGAQGSVGPIARPSAGPASCPPDGSGTVRSRNGRSGGHEELGRIPARTGTGPSRNVAPPGVPNRPPMSYLRCIAAARAFRQLVPASRRTGRTTSPRDRPGCFRAGCASLRCPQGP